VPLGDPFLLGTDHGAQTRQSLEALFGASFARAVFESEVNIWQGPIESAYGFHLVRVKERTEDRLPPVAEVRAQVLADWRQVRRQGANLDLYSKLRRRYQVEVDQSALAAVMHRK
jgi:parvulin-like peptidyl-prolyl isomerase